MKNRIYVCLMASLLLVMGMGCQNTTSNEKPKPPQVKLVAKSPDSALVETGIDAEEPPGNIRPNPLKNGIFLQWYSVEHEGLQAYDIYRRAADTTGSFTRIAEVLQAFGSQDTSYLDTTASLQTKYYYYVVARDEDGEEGERSKTDHYTLLPKPQQLTNPVGNGLFLGFFEWQFHPNYVPLYFIFRLEKQGLDNEYVPQEVKFLEVSDFRPAQHWTLDQVNIDSLSPGKYRWRIDIRVLRDNRQGAESVWGYFQVQ